MANNKKEITYRSITQHQVNVYLFLKSFISINGYPPTRKEIANNFNFKSENAAQEVINALNKKGYIKLIKGISRGISINKNLSEKQIADLNIGNKHGANNT